LQWLIARHQRRLVAGAAQTTNRTDERGAGGRWAGRRHRLTRTDDEDGSFGSLRSDSDSSCSQEFTYISGVLGETVASTLPYWGGARGGGGGGYTRPACTGPLAQ
jgi:hypothetical protein